MPAHTAPKPAVPTHTAPEAAVPAHTAPEGAVPTHTASEMAMSAHTAPEAAASAHDLPEAAVSAHKAPEAAVHLTISQRRQCQLLDFVLSLPGHRLGSWSLPTLPGLTLPICSDTLACLCLQALFHSTGLARHPFPWLASFPPPY